MSGRDVAREFVAWLDAWLGLAVDVVMPLAAVYVLAVPAQDLVKWSLAWWSVMLVTAAGLACGANRVIVTYRRRRDRDELEPPV